MLVRRIQYSFIHNSGAVRYCHCNCNRHNLFRFFSNIPNSNGGPELQNRKSKSPYVFAFLATIAGASFFIMPDYQHQHFVLNKNKQGGLRKTTFKNRDDRSSVGLMERFWLPSWNGTFLKRAQRKKMVDVLNLMVNMKGLTEPEEEVLFNHAVKQMEKALVKMLPRLMMRRMESIKGFDDFPEFFEENMYKGLHESVKLPYISTDNRELCIRCFTHFCLECMKDGENIDTILEDIGLLVAEIFLKGACMILHDEKREKLVADLAEDINIPVLPASIQKALVALFMKIAAGLVEESFCDAYDEYQGHHQKVDHEVSEEDLSRVQCKLSKLIHQRMKENVMAVLEMKYIKKEWYEDYIDFIIDKLIGKLLDREKLDTAGEAAVMIGKKKQSLTPGSGMIINNT